jgi:hypothetical protein
VAFLAVRFRHEVKKGAIESPFNRRHSSRREPGTHVLWQGEKRPGIGLFALCRSEEFRSEAELGGCPGHLLRAFITRRAGRRQVAPRLAPALHSSARPARPGPDELTSAKH